MDPKLAEIFRSIGIDEGEFYINDDGKIMKKSFPLDDFTGYYINKEGRFMKKEFPIDEPTGYALNKNNEFVKEGFFNEPTGFYLSSDGKIMKKVFLWGEETGYKFTGDNELVKEAGFGLWNEPKVNFKKPIEEVEKLEDEGADNFLIKFLVYTLLFIAAIWIALYVILISLALFPVVILLKYLFFKKDINKAWLLAGGILSLYLVFDNLNGMILPTNFGLNNDLAKMLAIIYGGVGISLIYLFFEKLKRKE